MKNFRFILLILIVCIVTSCKVEDGASPNSGISVRVETEISINDEPIAGNLLKEQKKYYTFSTQKGNEYIIAVRANRGSGTVDTYVYSEAAIKENNKPEYSDQFSNDFIDFRASKNSKFFIEVVDRGNEIGSSFTIRIFSPEHGITPFPNMPQLVANKEPEKNSLLKYKAIRYYSVMQTGILYKIVGAGLSGRTDKYVTEYPAGDNIRYLHADRYNNSSIEFRATRNGLFFISILEGGSDTGSSYDIRIISPDLPRIPLPNSIMILPTGQQTPGMIDAGNIRRYHFSAIAGKLYEISVRATTGSCDTYVSIYPCADRLVNEYADQYSNSVIRFRPTNNEVYFVGVQNRSLTDQATFTISVDQKD